jgi:acetoin utilization deacetylase AcuC-like enzyme
VELDDGTSDAPYLERLAGALDQVFDWRPDAVFYLAGADPFEGDRLGRLKLTVEGLRRRDALVLGRCTAAGIPAIITMSGGYATDIEAIVTIHTNTIRVAIASCARGGPGAPGGD